MDYFYRAPGTQGQGTPQRLYDDSRQLLTSKDVRTFPAMKF